MTKDQFISGQSFKVSGQSDYKGAATFKFEGDYIIKESRSSIEEEVLFSGYHLNVQKITGVGFEGFVYVMAKLVKVKYRFEDLELY